MVTGASCRLAGGRGTDATRPLLPLARCTWAAQKEKHCAAVRPQLAHMVSTMQRMDGRTRPHAAETRTGTTRAASA
jgi:hypothetical protein